MVPPPGGVALVGSLASVGLSVYLFGVFQPSIVSTFGIGVGQYALAHSLFIIVSGLLSPVVGRSIVTRGRPGTSIRTVMVSGAIAISLGLMLISRAESLSSASLAFVLLLSPGTVMLGPLVGQAMAINWFEARRGRALGIVAAGTTVGGVLIPPLAAFLIEAFGWRDALAMLGLLMLALPLPLVALFSMSCPEDIGEAPDGIPLPPDAEDTGKTDPQSTAALVRDRNLWIMGTCFALIFSSGTISVLFTVPYAMQLGFPLVSGAMLISIRSGAGALGKILLGSLSDRIGVKPVLWGVIGSQLVLTTFLIQTRDPYLFGVLAVLLGFVGGSTLPLKAALAGNLFGRASFASAMGLLQTVGVPFSLVLVPVAGYLYDTFGDYAVVFACTLPLMLIAGILLRSLTLPARAI